jgi:hypothetical protein
MRCSRIKQHSCRSVIDEKRTNDNIRSFLCFFHDHVIDSSTGVVLLGSKRNRVGFTGRGRCSCSGLISMSARIGASIGIMPLFTIHHSCSSYDWLAVDLGQLGSSEHFDSQQLESKDCWGAESLDAVG